MGKGLFAFVAVGFVLASSANGQTHNLKVGQVYRGRELLNERFTGNSCFITVQAVRPNPAKGLNCHTIEFLFASVRPDVPRDTLTVDSRLTNYHRPEFPAVRTCAMNTDGTTSGDAIYGDETAGLYNQIFGGGMQSGATRFDFFLTLAPDTKLLTRARVHIIGHIEEKDVDCVHLQMM